MKIWVITGFAVGVGICISVFAGISAPQDQDDVSRRDYMRMKLNFSQVIVEGVSTENFKLIASGAKEIKEITEGEQWMALDTPEYKRYSKEMQQAADRLMEMAKAKNLEGSALRFFDLTLKCVDCHKHIKNRVF